MSYWGCKISIVTSFWDNFHSGVPLSTENCKNEGLIILEIIELNRWNFVFLWFLGRGIQKLWLFSKLTIPSLIIHSEWQIVILVSNNGINSWNLVCYHILGGGIHIWHLFLKLTMSSLIIHRKVELSHFSVRQGKHITFPWIINEDMINFGNKCHIWIPWPKMW